ncbi:MAG: hypothetical protein WDO19_13220 [Bacteroidota bacterium]
MALYYEKLNKKAEADKFFKQVASYPMQKKGISKMALYRHGPCKSLGQADAATALIQKMIFNEKNKPDAEWLQAVFNKQPCFRWAIKESPDAVNRTDRRIVDR